MKVPRKLYKYQPDNKCSVANLTNNQLYFGKVVCFNDPFDSRIGLTLKTLTDDDYGLLFDDLLFVADKKGSSTEVIKELFFTDGKANDLFKKCIDEGFGRSIIEERKEEILLRGGVCCFSSKKNHILMWSHYANGHTGFSLEFDTSNEPFNKAVKVSYSEYRFALNPVEILRGDLDEYHDKAVTTKHTCWKYEAEWRLLHKENDKLYRYPKEALTGIYLGSEMPPDRAKELASIVQVGSPKVKIYRAKKQQEKFAIRFTR